MDRILSFIPPHLYVAAPIEEERKHYWMKPTETEKQMLKLKAKEGKRLRLDPTTGVSNVKGLQKKQNQKAFPKAKTAEEGQGQDQTAWTTEMTNKQQNQMRTAMTQRFPQT